MQAAKFRDEIKALQELAILRTYCEVAPVDTGIIDNAFNAVLIEKSFVDLEDAVQFYSALAVQADCILTRNSKDFSHSTILVLSPEEYLQHN